MKPLRIVFSVSVLALIAAPFFFAQDGPKSTGTDTVARPRKKGDTTPAPEAEQPKIPSKFNKKDSTPEGVPTFSTDATTVTVDVAVLDSKGHFIPKIPRGNFRILEDNVPQQISSFNMGEAPMTIALVVEFSARFQQFYSELWHQTLTAAYGIVPTLKPEDYIAVIAYDLRPEILSDFSTDRHDVRTPFRACAFQRFLKPISSIRWCIRLSACRISKDAKRSSC